MPGTCAAEGTFLGRDDRFGSVQPGEVHEYRSYCVLKSQQGWMEGTYRFVRDDGSTFDAVIPRFTLDA